MCASPFVLSSCRPVFLRVANGVFRTTQRLCPHDFPHGLPLLLMQNMNIVVDRLDRYGCVLSLSVVLLRLAVQVSAATHATREVVVIIVVVASTEEFLGPALEGLLERRHEAVRLVNGLVRLLSRHGDGGAARRGRRWSRHCWL
jgi:hypothetical protein